MSLGHAWSVHEQGLGPVGEPGRAESARGLSPHEVPPRMPITTPA